MTEVETSATFGSPDFKSLLESPAVPGTRWANDIIVKRDAFQPLCFGEPPVLQLFCNHKECQGLRHASCQDPFPQFATADSYQFFLTYHCKSCGSFRKLYSILFSLVGDKYVVGKVGEFPPFAPQTSAKLVSLLGRYSTLFFKGRQCEIHGQGIGAFAYYRRIVELSKNEILSLIEDVAKMSENNEDLISDIQAAKQETQFTKAVGLVKHALPGSLSIAGHNPLLVLHDCLSLGIHEMSDEECLQSATAVREVLGALAERVAELKRDQATLQQAISKIKRKG